MEITWHGQYCFRMTERGTLTVVADPFDASTGEEPPKVRADVVTISRDDPAHNNITAVIGAQRGDVRIVRGPGEYEMGGVFITGVAMKSDTKKGAASQTGTVYEFNFEGLSVVHLGGLSFVPSQAQIDALETVDVLLLPVGGGDGLNAAQASEIISLIEPSIVVPMNYKVGNSGGNRKLDSVSKFLKEMGLSEAKTQDSLKVTKSSLPEDTQVILLEVKQ
jgi:L-ascorbate metabolism protein UlaG (beta-lactamase superfamily)